MPEVTKINLRFCRAYPKPDKLELKMLPNPEKPKNLPEKIALVTD
jgi:hypothetical protein